MRYYCPGQAARVEASARVIKAGGAAITPVAAPAKAVVTARVAHPTDHPKESCAPPVQNFDLPQKGCPKGDVYSCVAVNADYSTFAAAWAACGTEPECGFIMKWTTGKYYLRRHSDPDQPVLGASSMRFSCAGRPASEGGGEATVAAAAPAAARTLILGDVGVASNGPKKVCSSPAKPKFDLPQKGCPT